MYKTVAISGGLGFIGFSFIEHYAHYFDKVILLVRPGRNQVESSRFSHAQLEIRGVDLLDSNQLRKALKNVDISIHLAYDSMNPHKNVEMLEKFYQASKEENVHRFVHLGSFSEYSPTLLGEMNENSPKNSSGEPYAKIKIEQSEKLKDITCFGTKSVNLKPTIVLGSGGNWSRTFSRIGTFKNLSLPFKGENPCNTVSVKDVCQALFEVSTKKDKEVFHQSLYEEFLISDIKSSSWAKEIKAHASSGHDISFTEMSGSGQIHSSRYLNALLVFIFSFFGIYIMRVVGVLKTIKAKRHPPSQISQEGHSAASDLIKDDDSLFTPKLFARLTFASQFKVSTKKYENRLKSYRNAGIEVNDINNSTQDSKIKVNEHSNFE